ncbi:hypothetical protein [Mucilaginibacter puniceus]
MSKKYLIFYLILGIIFSAIAIIGLVNTDGYSGAYFFIPAILFFYASFKIYKLESDDELM